MQGWVFLNIFFWPSASNIMFFQRWPLLSVRSSSRPSIMLRRISAAFFAKI